MKRIGIEGLLNLLFWSVTGWFIITTFAIVSHEIEIINDTEVVRSTWDGSIVLLLSLLLICCALLFYFNLWNITRLNELVSRRTVFAAGFGSLIGCLAVFWSIQQLPPLSGYPQLSHGLVLGIVLFYFAVSFGYGISKVWLKSEARRRELELKKKQAELDLLRSQLQPHFLFNVLNNLMAMVDQVNNPRLAESIDRLSGLLRHVVYDSAQEQIPIAKEIEFVRNYIDLQLLRFEPGEVNVFFSVQGEAVQWVEPGIFLPVIENAFKYGAVPEQDSIIRITFELSAPDRIELLVANPIHPDLPKPEAGGTGLAATRHRLQLVYPDRHELTIEADDWFRVKMIIFSEHSSNKP